jgi:uncharacterized LabA/DUF88 family protein
MKSERVIAYIDGFNLYFGLKDKGWRCYYWLNIYLLCQNLLRPPQHLVLVKYFTSRITSPPDKKKRQSIFLEALKIVSGIIPDYGIYQTTPVACEKCGHVNNIPEEKMTDVQISSEMVSDAYLNKYDTALLMTGDRDLVPAIEKVRSEFSKKRVVVAFPPMRTNDDLRGAANAYIHVTEVELKKSLLPLEIPTLGGYVLRCPKEWH